MTGSYETYDDVRARLDEIVDAVNAEGIGLDDALALYEEAVKLGLLACDLSEEDAEALTDVADGELAEGTAGAEGAQAAEAGVLAGSGEAAGDEGAEASEAPNAPGAPSVPGASSVPFAEA